MILERDRHQTLELKAIKAADLVESFNQINSRWKYKNKM
jgi:hypothetical protein